jgi:hypothetical protein
VPRLDAAAFLSAVLLGALRLRGREVALVSTPAGINAVDDIEETLLFDDVLLRLDIVRAGEEVVALQDQGWRSARSGWNALLASMLRDGEACRRWRHS